MNTFSNNNNISITASSNINNNLNQIIPRCNCPKCAQNKNKLVSPTIIKVNQTIYTNETSLMDTFPNNNNI